MSTQTILPDTGGTRLFSSCVKARLCEEFCRKMAKASAVPVEQLRAMARPDRLISYPAGQLLGVRGQAAMRPKIILSGWTSFEQILDNGDRMIFTFGVAGDFFSAGPTNRRLETDIVAITPVLALDASELVRSHAKNGDSAKLPDILYEAELQRSSQLYDQIVRLGSLNAADKVYDLLRELYLRLYDANNPQHGIVFPLTQEILADALGLSAVHINRTLQDLRSKGLVTLAQGRLIVHFDNRVHPEKTR